MSQFAPVGLRVPSGFEQLLESLAKEILRVQPSDITSFAADYFKLKLAQREERNNGFSENVLPGKSSNSGLMSSMEVGKDTSLYDKYPDVIQTTQQEITAESRTSVSPPPCSDDDHDDPNSETAALELPGSERLGSTHSIIEEDIDPNHITEEDPLVNDTEDDHRTNDSDLDRKSPPPDADSNSDNVARSAPNSAENPADDIGEPSPQIPDSDLVDKVPPPTSDQESLSPAGPDLDLVRSSPIAELNDEPCDAEETEQNLIDPAENSEEQC